MSRRGKYFSSGQSGVLTRAVKRSNELFSALNSLRYDPALNPHILDVRGRGLMIGVEFASPTSTSRYLDTPAPGTTAASHAHYSSATHPKNMAARVAKRCIEKGMLVLTASVYEAIRFIPPLNISKEDMRKGFEIFSESVREIVKET